MTDDKCGLQQTPDLYRSNRGEMFCKQLLGDGFWKSFNEHSIIKKGIGATVVTAIQTTYVRPHNSKSQHGQKSFMGGPTQTATLHRVITHINHERKLVSNNQLHTIYTKRIQTTQPLTNKSKRFD